MSPGPKSNGIKYKLRMTDLKWLLSGILWKAAVAQSFMFVMDATFSRVNKIGEQAILKIF